MKTVKTPIMAHYQFRRKCFVCFSICIGDGRRRGLLPCAGAAVELSEMCAARERSAVLYSTLSLLTGEAFCFLPLSIPTGFPVPCEWLLCFDA